MTKEELIELFKKHDDSYLEKPEGQQRRDLDAFNLIDRLCPGDGRDMISASEHDEFWLRVTLDDLAEVATEEDVIFLTQCGARIDDYEEGLAFFS